MPVIALAPLIVIPDNTGSINQAEIKAVLEEMGTARDGTGKLPQHDLSNCTVNCPFLFNDQFSAH
jgi:hypothetical protein